MIRFICAIVFIVLCGTSFSQNFTPLAVDSFYIVDDPESFSTGVYVYMDGLSIKSITDYSELNKISYDRQGRIKERIKTIKPSVYDAAISDEPISIHEYTYSGDTVFVLTKKPEMGIFNKWKPESMRATIYKNGQRLKYLSMKYVDGSWEKNPKWTTIWGLRNSFEYDKEGNRVAIYRYGRKATSEVWRGYHYFFNEENLPIRMLKFQKSIDDKVLLSTVEWNDVATTNPEKSTMLTRKHYLVDIKDKPEDWHQKIREDCFVKEFLSADTIYVSGYDWSNSNWQTYGKELTFDCFEDNGSKYKLNKKQEIEHVRPNKKIIYSLEHNTDGQFSYQEIVEQEFDEYTGKATKRVLNYWYHEATTKKGNPNDNSEFSFEAGPYIVGENLKVSYKLDSNKLLEQIKVLFFTKDGQFISATDLYGRSVVSLPGKQGDYLIVVKHYGHLIGYSELNVTE